MRALIFNKTLMSKTLKTANIKNELNHILNLHIDTATNKLTRK